MAESLLLLEELEPSVASREIGYLGDDIKRKPLSYRDFGEFVGMLCAEFKTQ